jgi:hypothetical protein
MGLVHALIIASLLFSSSQADQRGEESHFYILGPLFGEGLPRELEQSAFLEAWLLTQEGFGSMQKLSTMPFERVCDHAYGAERRSSGQPDLHNAIRKVNQKIVKACRYYKPMGGSVNQVTTNKCGGKIDEYVGLSRFSYRTSRNGAVAIDLNVRIKFDDDIEVGTSDAVMNRVQSCVTEVRSFWNRYGIEFNLQFDSEQEKKLGSVDHEVLYKKGDCRSDRLTYCEGSLNSSYGCTLILHETAHLVGLTDEYPEGCPDRIVEQRLTPPYSVMADSDRPFQELEFYPRNLIAFLNQFCDLSTLAP